MCNLYTQTSSIDAIRQVVKELGLGLVFPEGAPNLRPRDIRITDPAPIIRAGVSGEHDLVLRRWSWPAPGGKPVYNFRSDGREITSGRCLIIADGFYEYTAPADPRQKRKDRWLFTDPAHPLLGIAGLTRDIPGIGEAFTMLTTEPGPDVSPYHSRQVAVLSPADWVSWLDHRGSTAELIRPLPPGTLSVSPANL